jgi:hypothetical protein
MFLNINYLLVASLRGCSDGGQHTKSKTGSITSIQAALDLAEEG